MDTYIFASTAPHFFLSIFHTYIFPAVTIKIMQIKVWVQVQRDGMVNLILPFADIKHSPLSHYLQR